MKLLSTLIIDRGQKREISNLFFIFYFDLIITVALTVQSLIILHKI